MATKFTRILLACNITGMVEAIVFDKPRHGQPDNYFCGTRKGLGSDTSKRFDNKQDALAYAGIAETDMVVIEDHLAEEIADLYEANRAGYTHSWIVGSEKVPSTYDDGRPMENNGRPMMRGLYFHETNETLKALVPSLPANWKQAVDAIICARHEAERAANRSRMIAERRASYELVEDAAIRAYLLADVEARGRKEAKVTDLTGLCGLIKSAEKRGKPVYKPEAGCKAKLHLSRAVSFEYRQESYADHSVYAIPVTIEDDADLAICNRNLSRFCQSLSTHNGLAGSGSTHSAHIVESEEGKFVLLDMRHSIAD